MQTVVICKKCQSHFVWKKQKQKNKKQKKKQKKNNKNNIINLSSDVLTQRMVKVKTRRNYDNWGKPDRDERGALIAQIAFNRNQMQRVVWR